MSKVIKRMFSIILLFSLLTGCGINSDGNKNDDAPEPVPLEDAFNIEDVYNQSYDNLTIEQGIQLKRVGKIESAVYMIPDYEEYIYQNYDRIFKKLIGDKYNNKDVDTSEAYYPYGARIQKEDELNIALGCDGFFIWANKDALKTNYNYSSGDESACEAVFQNTKDNSNVEIKAGSDAFSYESACSYIEGQRKKILDILGIEFDSSSCICDIYQMISKEDDQPYVYVNMAQTIDGINIANVVNHYPEGKESPYLPWLEGGIYILGKEKPGEIILHGMGVLIRCEGYDAESVRQIISVKDAVRVFSNYLSEDLDYKVKDIRLEYRAKKEGNDQEDNPDKYTGKKIHRKKAEWSMSCSYDKFKMVPCWTIYIDQTPDKEIVGYVDCRTGETDFICNQK